MLISGAIIMLVAAAGFIVGSDDDGDTPASQPIAVQPQRGAPVATAPYAVPPNGGEAEPPATLTALARSLVPAPQRAGGYVVSSADAGLLAGTPLRAGDVLLEIDGQKLDVERMKRLSEELGRFEDVWVSFERDGKRIEMLLELK